jgi:hypothetical protein
MSKREEFQSAVERRMKNTGRSFQDAWVFTRVQDPELYAAMENEGKGVSSGMANEQFPTDRSTAPQFAPITRGSSELDAFIPGWAYRDVGLPDQSTLADLRQAIQSGRRLSESVAGTLRQHIATGFEKARKIQRAEAWHLLKGIFPEIFSDEWIVVNGQKFDRTPVAYGEYTSKDMTGLGSGTRAPHIPPDRYFVTMFPTFLKEALFMDGSQSDEVINQLMRDDVRRVPRQTAMRAIVEITDELARREAIKNTEAEMRLRRFMPDLFRFAGI